MKLTNKDSISFLFGRLEAIGECQSAVCNVLFGCDPSKLPTPNVPFDIGSLRVDLPSAVAMGLFEQVGAASATSNLPAPTIDSAPSPDLGIFEDDWGPESKLAEQTGHADLPLLIAEANTHLSHLWYMADSLFPDKKLNKQFRLRLRKARDTLCEQHPEAGPPYGVPKSPARGLWYRSVRDLIVTALEAAKLEPASSEQIAPVISRLLATLSGEHPDDVDPESIARALRQLR